MRRAVQRLSTLVVALTTVLAAAVPAAAAPASAAPNLTRAVKMTNFDPGRNLDRGDVRIALRRIGHDAGAIVDAGDRRRLLRWSARIRRAVTTAVAQVGDPYAWGGTGPNAFDCSGLMVYSWARAGVSLPRTSRSQAAALRSVSVRDMRVGDLLFFRSPVGHVAMYIGNGRFVDAPGRGRTVRIITGLHQRSDLVKVGRVLG